MLCRIHEYFQKGKPNAKYTLVKGIKFPKAYSLVINKIMGWLFNNKKILEWADVIHCRNIIGTTFAINILKKYKLKKPIIADIRGETVEEIRNRKKIFSEFYAFLARKMETFLFERSAYFFFVSNNMKMYYSTMYHLRENRSSVFPTIVDETYFYKSEILRTQMRNKLTYKESDYIYVYVGGTEYWQNVDKILLKFNESSKKDDSLYLLVISKHILSVERLISSLGIANNHIKIISLPYNEVGSYLNACNAGIIIRDHSIINYVASPTKINEYIACGLQIINELEQIGNKSYNSIEYTYKNTMSIIKEQNMIYHRVLSDYYTNL